VTGYVRAFVPLLAILAVDAVPTAIIGAFVGNTAQLSASLAQPGAATDPEAMQRAGSVFVALALYALLGTTIALIARTACVIYIAAVTDERPLSVGTAFRRALPRWLPQVGLAIIVGLFIAVVSFVVTLAIVLIAFVVSLVARAGAAPSALETALGIGVFIVAAVVAAAVTLVAVLIYELAMVSVALDEGGPWRSIKAAAAAVFDRGTWRNTLAVGASLLAVSLLGVVLSIAIGSLILVLTHLLALQIVLQAIVSILVAGLVQWFIVLYARDVRNRRSGADLIRLAESAPA
jgi:hypothetical protein